MFDTRTLRESDSKKLQSSQSDLNLAADNELLCSFQVIAQQNFWERLIMMMISGS